ncbi:hypothetical protein N7453_005344 [Penicillium expansum]|nr:hypothetical protein N7453_005344 [Penicillium expansum]
MEVPVPAHQESAQLEWGYSTHSTKNKWSSRLVSQSDHNAEPRGEIAISKIGRESDSRALVPDIWEAQRQTKVPPLIDLEQPQADDEE